MPRSRAPFCWYGGKSKMIARLLPLVPEHRTYVEPFCGAASLLFAKEPAAVETINDLDSDVANFFRVLRDQPEEFMRLARLSEYGRELYAECRAEWRNETDPVRRAWRWWYVATTSFSGCWGSCWGTSVRTSSRGMADACSGFRSRVEDVLPACIERLQRVQIENTDALAVIRRYATEDGFCYVDPPYIKETRYWRGGYRHDDMTEACHAALVECLLETPGAVLLSGCAHPVYEPLESAGWLRRDWKVACNAVGRTRRTGIQGVGSATEKRPRTESVWMNPELQRRINVQPEMGV